MNDLYTTIYREILACRGLLTYTNYWPIIIRRYRVDDFMELCLDNDIDKFYYQYGVVFNKEHQ